MSAIVDRVGRVRQLDRPAAPDEPVTEEQVSDFSRLARLLMRLLAEVAFIRRRFWPRHVDHEDREVDDTGTTVYRFPHGFNGRVRWWAVDWVSNSGLNLAKHESSDKNTLALTSQAIGVVTIRIEEAG